MRTSDIVNDWADDLADGRRLHVMTARRAKPDHVLLDHET